MGLFFCIILFAAGGTLAWAVLSRRRQYRYRPDRDYAYAPESSAVEVLPLSLDGETCSIVYGEGQTVIVRCRIRSRWYGRLLQPYVETASENGTRRHYVEHGARGARYLDLTEAAAGERTVRFRAHRCRIEKTMTLFRYENPLDGDAKVLVLAPHADDAEIAAFGLYAGHDAHIVTITAGEDGKCDYCDLFDSVPEGRMEKGLLRVHDALHIPDLGGVGVARCAVLGYYGMTLKQMYAQRGKTVPSNVPGVASFAAFRRTSHTSFIGNSAPETAWDSLVRDLQSALEILRPDVVVTPHPQIDSNSDHVYTTVALAEAMRNSGYGGRVLAYTNHHALGESYPCGPIFSTATLPPWFESPFAFDGIYSHALPRAAQVRKFFALEAMHDLRDATLPLSLAKTWKQLKRMLKRDLGGRDKSYFRRAVRTNELFYVFDAKSLESAIKR